MLTDVLSTPTDVHKFQELAQSRSLTSFPLRTIKIPSAVELDVVHISKNQVATLTQFMSKILTAAGYIFSKPVSFEPIWKMDFHVCD